MGCLELEDSLSWIQVMIWIFGIISAKSRVFLGKGQVTNNHFKICFQNKNLFTVFLRIVSFLE